MVGEPIDRAVPESDPQGTPERILLLLKHRSMLIGYITLIVQDPHLAEDVFQEVAVIVFRKADALTSASMVTCCDSNQPNRSPRSSMVCNAPIPTASSSRPT